MSKPVALISGVTSDIGRAIVKALIADFDIAGQYLSNEKEALVLKQFAADHNSSLRLYPVDLSLDHNAADLVKQVGDDFGKIDVLINTVGPFFFKNIRNVSPLEWKRTIDLNLNVTFSLTHYAIPYLEKSEQAHILNFSFSGAQNLKAWPDSTSFCAAKAGIVILTKSLASELAPDIRVNAISPGIVRDAPVHSEGRKKRVDQIPFGAIGKPDELAQIIHWLLLESPSYLTGSIIPFAGGWEY